MKRHPIHVHIHVSASDVRALSPGYSLRCSVQILLSWIPLLQISSAKIVYT